MGKEMAELNILLLATQTVLSSGIFFFYMHGLYGSPYGYLYTYSAELVRHLVCWSNMEQIHLEGSSDVAEVWGSLQNIGPA